MAVRIRTGDRVIVTSGSNKGQVGNVTSIKLDQVKIDGVNLMVKHIKKTGEERGRIENIIAPIHVSNVAHVDINDKPVKVCFIIKDGVKYLVHRKDKSKEIRKV